MKLKKNSNKQYFSAPEKATENALLSGWWLRGIVLRVLPQHGEQSVGGRRLRSDDVTVVQFSRSSRGTRV